MALYRDRCITCDDEAITIRAYYFPWGSKRIGYDQIRSATVVPIAAGSGKGRIWGTANPTLWASLDPRRPSKDRALILDIGGRIRPFLTPDDVDTVARIIQGKAGVSVSSADRGEFSSRVPRLLPGYRVLVTGSDRMMVRGCSRC